MVTDFGALSALQKKIWSARVWKAGRDASFFMGTPGMMGNGTSDATKPIHKVDELTKDERGDRCVMPIVLDLDGDGVAGDNILEGNEESLVADSVEIVIDQIRNGVKSKGRMSEQRTVLQFRTQTRDKLGFWLGNRVDEMMFLAASGRAFTLNLDGSTRPGVSQLPSLQFAASVTAPTSNRQKFPGANVATSTLTTGDKMSWTLLVSAKATAIRRRLKPIRMNGQNTYLVVMSPEQSRDLKTDTDYKTIVANGGNRGKTNELFTGAFAMVDGLVLFDHAKVCTNFGTSVQFGAGSNVPGCLALLMGAQAMGFASIGEPAYEESSITDYKNRPGSSYGQILGIKKPLFQSLYDKAAGVTTAQDFSIIVIYTAAAV